MRVECDLSSGSALLCSLSLALTLTLFSLLGDRNNLVFSSIYRGDVPIYFRQRFCIGLAPDERITYVPSIVISAIVATWRLADQATALDSTRMATLSTSMILIGPCLWHATAVPIKSGDCVQAVRLLYRAT